MKCIIDFLDETSQSDINNYMVENNITIRKVLSAFGKVYICETVGDAEPPNTEIIENIVEDLDLSLSFETETINVPVNDENWWKIVSWGETEVTYNTKSIDVHIPDITTDVYLFDSGVDASHPEFSGQTITDLFTVVDGDYSDVSGHGTQMASLITGNTCSMSRANLFNVKIYSDSGVTTLGNLMEAMDVVKTRADATPDKIAVANMSWITQYNSYLNAKVQQMINSGIVVVVAAGNQGEPIDNLSPASVADSFVIGAYTQDLVPADFTNYDGPGTTINTGVIDRWAPGVDIRVAAPGGGYQTVNGTSSAAAITSGSICFNAGTYHESFVELFGEAESRYDTARNVDFYLLVAQRTGLLTLNEPYDICVNKIITYATAGTPVHKANWNHVQGMEMDLNFVTNELTTHQFMYPYSEVDTVTELTDLPAGCRIYKGWLIGNLTPLPDGELTRTDSFSLRVTGTNGVNTTLNVHITLKTTDDQALQDYIDSAPEDDPITILLQTSCIGGGSPGPFGLCANDCPNSPASRTCFSPSFKGGTCDCIPI